MVEKFTCALSRHSFCQMLTISPATKQHMAQESTDWIDWIKVNYGQHGTFNSWP